MIKSIAIALAALVVSGQAFAQNTTPTTPDGIGGWDTTTTAPNGHVIGRGSSTPNGIGGWDTMTTAPNGHVTGNSTTMPDGIGGWITTPSVHR